MNIKQLKSQSLLQEALCEALCELSDTRLRSLAITKVELSAGKESAKVFLDENSLGDMVANDALKLLKKANGAIRANLHASLDWYKVPNLSFEIDRDLAQMNRLDEIFKKIHAKENAESALDSANSQNLVKNQSCEAPLNSPASWCKKSESKGAEVPRADFLLEAEKRGSPPKSEKAAAFWETHLNVVGGSGNRGVQPFLREKISEISGNIFAESRADSMDSVDFLQGGLPRRFCESARNDEFIRDSSLRLRSAQNDKIKAKSGNFGGKVAESTLDSTNKNNPSLRADSQNLRGKPPCDSMLFLKQGLPRSHSLARNDNCGKSAESNLDSAPHSHSNTKKIK